MKKRIVLCADDYGQAPAISQGILALIKAARLSAVSCMTNTSYWQSHAEWLHPFKDNLDIGLHFTLTEGPITLPRLIVRSIFGQLDRQAIKDSLHSQLDAFQQKIGRKPDFLDGHQHVHQFPLIRDAFLEVYKEWFPDKKAYVRVINCPHTVFDLKRSMIKGLGTKPFTKLLDANKIPYNQTFSGIYSFNKSRDYPNIFPFFLNEIGDGGLIMCHPGLPSSPLKDPIAHSRYFEYQYLSGLRFKMDCEANGVVLDRFASSNIVLLAKPDTM